MASSKDVTIPRWAFVLGCFLLVAVILAFWSKLRSNSVELHVERRGTMAQFAPAIAGLAHGELTGGNHVVVLQNGEFFESLLRDIAAAKQTIHFESYVWWEGEICERMATALAASARRGVVVRVLLDASGSHKMAKPLVDLMEKSGVQLAKFHPLRISNIGRMNNRDHRKIAVIDGHIGYTGGHGVAEEWTGNAQDKKHWRDTFVRVEGPVVHQLQGAFAENWIEETGKVFIGPQYFPPIPASGPSSANVAFSSPSGTISSVQLLYYLAICSANKEILIQNPYFLPDAAAIEALAAAVKRGVHVSVMIPAASVNDSPIVQHASHHHYGTLLKRGVHIFEYQKTLLHSKVIVVDGVWSTVGSTNFDDRSFAINDEVCMGIYDPQVAEQLRAAFANDLHSSKEIHLAEWKDRGFFHKLKDGFFYTFNYEL